MADPGPWGMVFWAGGVAAGGFVSGELVGERACFQKFSDPVYGNLTLQMPVWRMTETPPRIRWARSRTGSHDASVYQKYLGWGVSRPARGVARERRHLAGFTVPGASNRFQAAGSSMASPKALRTLDGGRDVSPDQMDLPRGQSRSRIKPRRSEKLPRRSPPARGRRKFAPRSRRQARSTAWQPSFVRSAHVHAGWVYSTSVLCSHVAALHAGQFVASPRNSQCQQPWEEHKRRHHQSVHAVVLLGLQSGSILDVTHFLSFSNSQPTCHIGGNFACLRQLLVFLDSVWKALG